MTDYAIFVQARLGSTRFPKKILHQIGGKRVLDHVLESCQETGIKTFLLVPYSEEDAFKSLFSIDVHGGSEKDVLSRFSSCARENDVKNIVRITSDCPCLPSSHITAVVEEHKRLGGFVTNVNYEAETYSSTTNTPDGFDVEVFSRQLLDEADQMATEERDREHVTPWMRRKGAHIANFSLVVDGKFSIDTREDLDRVNGVLHLLRSLKTVKI